MNVKRWLAIPAAALLLSVAACGSNSPPPAQPAPVLRIGVDLPTSGREVRAAVPAWNGIRFFVQTHPMLDGFDVVLVGTDDAQAGGPSPDLGAANVQSFVADPTVVAMIGPFDAAVARREIPVANAASLAMISPATSSPCLTRDIFVPAQLNPARTDIDCKTAGLPPAAELRPTHVNNFFRLTTTDDLQGAAAADYVFTKLHRFRAAAISDHEAYGQGLADAFAARFTNLGGTVVGRLDLDPAQRDATAFLTQVKAESAQAIYYGGATSGGGCAVRAQMKAVFPPELATPFLGGDGIAQDPACVRAARDNGAGMYATVPFVDASAVRAASTAIRDFKRSFGRTSDYGPYTMLAYDATAVLYSALNRAIQAAGGERPSRASVVAQLARTTGVIGITGTVGFDAAGDTTNRVLSIFEATSTDPRTPWKLVDTVDYSARLPY